MFASASYRTRGRLDHRSQRRHQRGRSHADSVYHDLLASVNVVEAPPLSFSTPCSSSTCERRREKAMGGGACGVCCHPRSSPSNGLVYRKEDYVDTHVDTDKERTVRHRAAASFRRIEQSRLPKHHRCRSARPWNGRTDDIGCQHQSIGLNSCTSAGMSRYTKSDDSNATHSGSGRCCPRCRLSHGCSAEQPEVAVSTCGHCSGSLQSNARTSSPSVCRHAANFPIHHNACLCHALEGDHDVSPSPESYSKRSQLRSSQRPPEFAGRAASRCDVPDDILLDLMETYSGALPQLSSRPSIESSAEPLKKLEVTAAQMPCGRCDRAGSATASSAHHTREAKRAPLGISASQAATDTAPPLSPHAAREERLRRKFQAICTCYWSQLTELETPINPASHAATCPCQEHQALWESLQGDRNDSTSPCSYIELSSEDDEERKQLPDKKERVPDDMAAKERIIQVQSTSSARPLGRAAVFGTTQRRTVFDLGSETVVRSTSSPLPVTSCEAAGTGNDGQPVQGDGKRLAVSPRSSRGRSRVSDVASPKFVPGPGAYNVSESHQRLSTRASPRAVSIGRAPRQQTEKPRAPGPGAYDLIHELDGSDKRGVSAPFSSTAERNLHFGLGYVNPLALSSPGPCEYSPGEAAAAEAHHRTAPSYSFGRASAMHGVGAVADDATLRSRSELPGPADYDVRTGEEVSSCRKNKGAVMLSSPRHGPYHNMRSEDTPGPGAYDVDTGERLIRAETPAVSFTFIPESKTRASVEDQDELPGPGQYDLVNVARLSQERSVPQWTIRGGRSLPKSEDPTPGPAEYVPVFTTGGGSAVFGTTPRAVLTVETQDDAVPQTPGPGTYHIEDGERTARERQGMPVFSKAPRVTVLDEVQKRSVTVPGPGAYEVEDESTRKRAAIPILATSSRRFPDTVDLLTVKERLPGPGDYEIAAQIDSAKRPGAVIGSAPRRLLLDEGHSTDNNVGPGSYDLPALPVGPSVLLLGRPLDRDLYQEAVPGPGTYELQDAAHFPNAPRTVIGTTSARFNVSATEREKVAQPGPGEYDPTQTSLGNHVPSGVVIGTAPRILLEEDERRRRDNTNLGPGSYQLDRPSESRVVTLPVGPRFPIEQAIGDIPGPGSYQMPPVFSSQGAVFGTGAGHLASDGDRLVDAMAVPGPGAYSPQYTQTDPNPQTPAFSMYSARADSFGQGGETGTVGPGSYSTEPPQPHSFHATFSLAQRDDGQSSRSANATVGPGQYNVQYPGEINAPRVVLGTAPRLDSCAGSPNGEPSVPGPGAYQVVVTRQGQSLLQPAKTVSFSTAQRELHETAKDVPGPGAYTTPAEMERWTSEGRKGVVFGTATQRPDEVSPLAHEPGPGSYQPNIQAVRPQAVQYSIGTGPRDAMSAKQQAEVAMQPGPGAYTVDGQTQWVLPGYQGVHFGEEKRFPEAANEEVASNVRVPGPGYYEPRHTLTEAGAPTYAFGTAARSVTEATSAVATLPGPGDYDVRGVGEVLGIGRAARFGNASRFMSSDAPENSNGDGVGPGHYSPRDPKWDPAPPPSFGKPPAKGSTTGLQTDSTPGPGAYTMDQAAHLVQPTAPAYAFGKQARTAGTLQAADSPGPGWYTLPEHHEGPAYAFGTAPSGRVAVDGTSLPPHKVPGPGMYDVKDTLPQGPAFSIHKSDSRPTLPEQRAAAEVPGPGSYLVERSLAVGTSTPSVTVTKAVRFPEVHPSELLPGPGAYSPALSTGPAASFPKAPRLGVGEGATTSDSGPGPGQYDVQSKDLLDGGAGATTVPFRSTAARFEVLAAEQQDTPGPAHYPSVLLPGVLHTGPSFTLAERFPDHTAIHPDGVDGGPGWYDIPPTLRIDRGYSFGSGPRMPPQSADEASHPGPGTYDLVTQHTVGHDGPAFSFVSRQPDRDAGVTRDVPGPGSYNLLDAEGITGGRGSRAYTIGGRLTTPNGQMEIPGPGSYDTVAGDAISNHERAPAFSITGKPLYTVANMEVPGPGTYNIDRPFGVDGPAYTLIGKGAPAESVSATPGPGMYDTVVPPGVDAPAFSISGKPRETYDDPGRPGPGAYYTLPAPESPSFTFPGASRETGSYVMPSSTADLGPGEYYHHGGTLVSVPERAHTFPQADRMAPTSSPCKIGPGQYHREVVWGLGTAPAFTLAERQDKACRTGPGPGTYYTEPAWGTDGITFSRSSRPDQVLNHNPGPGSYFRDYPVTPSAGRKRDDAATLQKLVAAGYPVLHAQKATALSPDSVAQSHTVLK